jgi:SAM-dependent methyltransferase
MSTEAHDQEGWERRWERVLAGSTDAVDRRPPNARLVEVAAALEPGRALDAGAGHGTEALWLATRGWGVTAVDFSRSALNHAATRADELGREIAERITWQEGDLGQWTPQAEHFDLVSCLYVHIAGSVPEMIQRLAAGVAPGGHLLLVGHRPVDPVTGAPTRAADQVQVSVEDALTVLDQSSWELLVAEDRPRQDGNGVDAAVHAQRRP